VVIVNESISNKEPLTDSNTNGKRSCRGERI
jgi:hypothetical protein